MSLQFGIRQCIFVFCVQIIVAIFFGYDALPLNGFLIKRFTLTHTVMRIVCSIFLQMTLNKELKNTLKMLTYLKNQRGNSKNLKGRYINYTLCFMQMLSPMISQVMFSIQAAQEPNVKMVIKGFVTLGLITRLDDMFAASFPGELKENAEALSASGVLKM